MGTLPLGAVKSCCETLLRVMTLSHVVRTQTFPTAARHSMFSRLATQIFFFVVILNMAAVFVAVAGDGERHAGLPSAVQREAERFNPLTRAQCSDHYGERPQTTQ